MSGEIDDERHLLMSCPIFAVKRACFFGKLSSISPQFNTLSEDQKIKFILCPTSEIITKVVNKYIRIIFNARDNIDKGIDISANCYPTYTPPFTGYDFEHFSDTDEGEASFCSSSSDD